MNTKPELNIDLFLKDIGLNPDKMDQARKEVFAAKVTAAFEKKLQIAIMQILDFIPETESELVQALSQKNMDLGMLSATLLDELKSDIAEHTAFVEGLTERK